MATRTSALDDDRLGSFAVVLAALLTFARGVFNPLHASWDDQRVIIDNPLIHRVSSENLARIWGEVRFEAYQPLHLLSYWLDVPWAGTSGPVLHTTNLILWCVVLVLFRATLRQLGGTPLAATLATLLCGLHPVNVELVSWATGRKDIMAMLFGLAATSAHLRASRLLDGTRALSIALFGAALLSKTAILPLPAVWFVLDVLVRGRPWRSAWVPIVPSLVLASLTAYAVHGIWGRHELIRPDADPRTLVPASLAHYLMLTILPLRLSPMYALARESPPDLGTSMLVVVAFALIVVQLMRARRHESARLALAGAISFAILLIPVLNIVPLYFQWSDRYLGIPMLGVGLVAIAILDTYRHRAVGIGGAGLALLLALRSIAYQDAWSSDIALWEHATRAQPESFYAWIKLGQVRRDSGDGDAARSAFERAVALSPTLSLGHISLFSLLLESDAAEHQLTVTELEERALLSRYLRVLSDPEGLRRLGGDLMQGGFRDSTLFVLDRAFDLSPATDDQLERAARIQLERGNEWLARFYRSKISRIRETRAERGDETSGPGSSASKGSNAR